MAKMKVYELAQEMGLQSKDILTALKNKGIEVKSHMSVLEDGQVEDLKNSLKAPAKSEETPKAAEADKKEQPADAKAPVKKKIDGSITKGYNSKVFDRKDWFNEETALCVSGGGALRGVLYNSGFGG